MGNLTDNIDITGTGGSPLTTTASNTPSAFGYDNSIGNSSLTNDLYWSQLQLLALLMQKLVIEF
jgi:hypothetical protein